MGIQTSFVRSTNFLTLFLRAALQPFQPVRLNTQAALQLLRPVRLITQTALQLPRPARHIISTLDTLAVRRELR